MENLFKALAIVLGIAIPLSFTLPARGETQSIVVIENDWPPYYFGTHQSKPPGFAREVIDHCLANTEYVAEYTFFPVKRMYAYLEKGNIDLALFSYKKSREDFVVYANEPLFSSAYRPVVRRGEDISIHTLADFDKLRLGHLAGLKYSPDFLAYVEKRKQEGSLVTTTAGGNSLKMLLENIIDVFVDTRDTVLWRASTMGVKNDIQIIDYDVKTSDYFITISKNSPRISAPQPLLDNLDECVRNLKKGGLYRRIAEKYGIQ